MANRVIRDWTASENVDELSVKAEVFFTRLIMKADDYGNYTANLKLISAALFPLKRYEYLEIDGWLNECIEHGLIKRYEVDGKKYIHIVNFDQTLRRMKHTFPPPPDGYFLTVDGQVLTNDGQMTAETKRNESETESETEREGEKPSLGLKKNFDWWWSQIKKDQIWLTNIQSTHSGKDIEGGAREAHLSLMSNELRLRNTDLSGFKGYVNSWLSNKKQNDRTGSKKAAAGTRNNFSGNYGEAL